MVGPDACSSCDPAATTGTVWRELMVTANPCQSRLIHQPEAPGALRSSTSTWSAIQFRPPTAPLLRYIDIRSGTARDVATSDHRGTPSALLRACARPPASLDAVQGSPVTTCGRLSPERG